MEMEIAKVEDEIKAVEVQIEHARQEYFSNLRAGNEPVANFWRDEIAQLHDEKKQLRDEKKLLREKELKLTVPPTVQDAVAPTVQDVVGPVPTMVPLFQASYEQILDGHERVGWIYDTQAPTWTHPLVRNHGRLGAIAAKFQSELGRILAAAKDDMEATPNKWIVEICQKEPDDSYESGGQFLSHLTSLVYKKAFPDEYRDSVGVLIRANKKLRSSPHESVSSPDLVSCGLKLNFSELSSSDVYSHLQIVWEFKVDEEKFRDAMGECLDRAQRSRMATNAKEKIVYAAATTGMAFRPMIILSQRTSGQVVRGLPAFLGSASEDKARCKVDIDTPAFKEVLFQVYASLYFQLRFPMEAAAEPQDGVARRPPEKHILRCGDVEHEMEVVHSFRHMTLGGGTYLVHCPSLSEELLVVKRGPRPAARDLIVMMHGGMPVRTWNQVETELSIRHLLDVDTCIPELVVSGEFTSPWCWADCPALVMKFHGCSLENTTLSASEVVAMGAVLIKTVAELHRKGVYHTDISPRNVLSDCGKFYLIDLGVALRVPEERRSHILDLEFGSMDAVCRKELTPTADFEGILYTMVKVLGMDLPWSEAARQGDLDSVIRIRGELRSKGSVLGNMQCPHEVFAILEAFILGKTDLQCLLAVLQRGNTSRRNTQSQRYNDWVSAYGLSESYDGG